jgi:hypothetical protein
VWADQEGGPEALHVKNTVSDRYGFTDPPSPRYVPNQDLAVDDQNQTQSESGGWSVTVTRIILRGGNADQVVEEQEWVVRYAARFAVIEVHPCMIPETTTPCPTTTTTTVPTTTTTVPATTTTVPTTTTTG